MTPNRRAFFGGAALAAAAPALAPSLARADDAPAAPSPTGKIAEEIAQAAAKIAKPMSFAGGSFGDEGWAFLTAEARAAEVVMFGEEHGVSEGAQLARALFGAVRPDHLAIEISPPMATEIDGVLAAGGVEGLKRYYAEKAPKGVAFFTLREEAEILAAARATRTGGRPVLWGLDYEVAGDRRLIARLKAARPPAFAVGPLKALDEASAKAQQTYAQTKNPGALFTFGGDPALVAAVRKAWPKPSAEADLILETLEQTLRINNAWIAGDGWTSNDLRARFMKANFAREWREARAGGKRPKLMMKFGASHMLRGRNTSEVNDVGNLAASAAELDGAQAFNLLVVGGRGAEHAVFDPVGWSYRPAPVDGAEGFGLGAVAAALPADRFSVVDLRVLRPKLPGAKTTKASPLLMRAVQGFDALVVLAGAKASSML